MIQSRNRRVLLVLALVAAAALLGALLAGPSSLPPGAALRALWDRSDPGAHDILWHLRLPRALAAFAVGSLLALSGVLLQALFRNPLADPFVMGVSGGAAVGALAAMALGADLALQHGSALAGALLVGLVVLWLGRGGGNLRLLLGGVIMASACGAFMTLILTLADEGQLRGMVFWLAGNLDWADQPRFNLLMAALALTGAVVFARVLNVLAAGELRSASVGLDSLRATRVVYVVAAALTAIAVLAAGTIGFVGLVAPHLARMAFRGNNHRWVAPGAVLLGGALLCAADAASRTLAAPRQLPVGAVMALIGAPVFMVLMRRT
ncbi:MAG TPA: iron ABC transporter permease [Steroidobacteraceae bacterium]|nr:iron ABC transporter permease [Steroidobacteraceae bacterium]